MAYHRRYNPASSRDWALIMTRRLGDIAYWTLVMWVSVAAVSTGPQTVTECYERAAWDGAKWQYLGEMVCFENGVR